MKITLTGADERTPIDELLALGLPDWRWPALRLLVDDVLAKHPDPVAQYRSGKTTTFGFLVGQVMKAGGGKANPKRVNELLKKALGSG